MKKHTTPLCAALLACALVVITAAALGQSPPAAGSVAVQVKNEGSGSTTYWIGPGSPPVLQGIASGGTPALFSLGSGLSIADGTLTLPASAFGLTLIDDADAAAARTTLGLGTLATQSATITDYLTTASAASTYVALAGSYSDPAWITSLAWSKITGAPSFLTGNQTITLSGDVTGSGATAITTAIANDAVTFAKIQNISTGHLIGRHSSGWGDPQQLGLGAGLEMSGANVRLSNSGVTAGNYGPASMTVDATGRVTSAASYKVNDDDGSSGGALVAMVLDDLAPARFGIPFFHNPNWPDPADPIQTAWLVNPAGTDGRRIFLPAVEGTLLTTTGNGGSLTNLDPYALQQRSASDGQALVWSTANSRWQPGTVSGSGTVTRVEVTGSDGIQVDSGSPITSSGTIALGIDASALSSHLGLGGAALLNVGTTAGTVAAGDDARFHAAVTLAGAPDYLTISGQEITRGLIDLGTDVTGTLPWASVSKTGSSLADLATRSAGDLTSGTLDAARLPVPTTTTLGGVKRNTGSGGQFVTGINTDGELTYDTPAGGGGGTTIYGPPVITSDVVSSTDASWTDIASVSLAANTRYELELNARHTSNAGATGPAFGVDLSSAPANYLASVTVWTAAAGSTNGTATASGEVITLANGAGGTARDVRCRVSITTGGSATTLKFQVKINSGDSGTVTVEEPIFVHYHTVTAP